jgi:hypothetical protein
MPRRKISPPAKTATKEKNRTRSKTAQKSYSVKDYKTIKKPKNAENVTKSLGDDKKLYVTTPVPNPYRKTKEQREFDKQNLPDRIKYFVDKAAKTMSTPEAVVATEGEISPVEAQKMLSKPSVVGEVLTQRGTLAATCGITAERVMRGYAAIGFSTMQDYIRVDQDGDPHIDLSNLTEAQWAAVSEITIEETLESTGDYDDKGKPILAPKKRTKFKLYPKEVALDKMAKHLGIKGFGGLGSKLPEGSLTARLNPDGTMEVTATTQILNELSTEKLERIAAGIEDEEEDA